MKRNVDRHEPPRLLLPGLKPFNLVKIPFSDLPSVIKTIQCEEVTFSFGEIYNNCIKTPQSYGCGALLPSPVTSHKCSAAAAARKLKP